MYGKRAESREFQQAAMRKEGCKTIVPYVKPVADDADEVVSLTAVQSFINMYKLVD